MYVGTQYTQRHTDAGTHTHTHTPHTPTHTLIRNEKWTVCFSPFQRQLYLPMQCRPHPRDMKVRFGVNGFGTIGCLVTRDAFNSGQVDTVPSRISSLTSSTHDTSSCATQFIESSTIHSRLRTGNLSSTGRLSPSFRGEITPISNGVWLVLIMLWSSLCLN